MGLIETIFLEKAVRDNPYAKRIVAAYKGAEVRLIDKLERIFDGVKRPYVSKRDGLRAFIGEKKGVRVKQAPEAYGVTGEKHYYFVHAYNCIYECEYCYLQGYFNSPDLVFYVNHDEIIEDIKTILNQEKEKRVWFHAGEFSDSLSLSHITGEWKVYWDFFAKHSRAFLELRTKSVNLKGLQFLKPLSNVVISYSLSSAEDAKRYDRGAPSLRGRLQAIKALAQRGFYIGIHFDPIVIHQETIAAYEKLIEELLGDKKLALSQLSYVSLGVVRFTKKAYREVQKNYPNSQLVQTRLIEHDQKKRTSLPKRMDVLEAIQTKLMVRGVPATKVYFCMEK